MYFQNTKDEIFWMPRVVFLSQKNYVLIYQTSLTDKVKLKLESVFYVLKFGF
jgi:hypothetical protein